MFIQVPNPDLGVCQKGVHVSKRVASCLICHLGEKVPCLGISDGSGLVVRGASEIVNSGMKSENCHKAVLGQTTYARGIQSKPNSNSGTWGGRDNWEV